MTRRAPERTTWLPGNAMKTLAAAVVALIVGGVAASRNPQFVHSLYSEKLSEEGLSAEAIKRGWERTTASRSGESRSAGSVQITATPRLKDWPTGKPIAPHMASRSGKLNVQMSVIVNVEGELPFNPARSSDSSVTFEMPLPSLTQERVVEVAAGWESYINSQGDVKALPAPARLFLNFDEIIHAKSTGGSVVETGPNSWTVKATDPEAPFELDVVVRKN